MCGGGIIRRAGKGRTEIWRRIGVATGAQFEWEYVRVDLKRNVKV